MAEKKTESSFEKRIEELGYPKRDIEGKKLRVWSQSEFSSSNENIDKFLNKAWAHASKQKGKDGIGKPEYTIRHIDKDLIIVVECKPDNNHHSSCVNFDDYKNYEEKLKNKETASQYAVDGALHYASFIKDFYNVLAVGVSGNLEKGDYKLTSFFWRKGTGLSEIILKDNGKYKDTFQSYDDYYTWMKSISESTKKTKDQLQLELTAYANRCNAYLRKNDVNPEARAGYIAGCLIALETKNFRDKVSKSFTTKLINSREIEDFNDMIDINTSSLVNLAQEEQWSKLPEYKKKVLKKYYNGLYSSYGNDPVKHLKNGFEYGNNVLSTLVHSLYKNIYLKKKKYIGIDVMGQFYTAFLKYAKSDASDKSIVLTPKHITDLFCDLAEYFLDTKLDENIKVVDICCGTGSFLISAMERMFENIDNMTISDKTKVEKKDQVQLNCLIGVEKNINMYALAYSNMNFHGDGKSNLYYGSSLLSDEENYKLDKDDKSSVSLLTQIKSHKARVGFINPPYSLDSDSRESNDEKKRKREIELNLYIQRINDYLNKSMLENELIDEINNILTDIKSKLKDIDNFDRKENNPKNIKRRLIDIGIIDKNQIEKDANKKYKEENDTKEIDFVSSMLSCLEKDGIGIVIMPMACGSKEEQKRRKLLENNTLLAVMSMPSKLFYESDVSVVTSIYVFKVGTPHNDYKKPTFFSRWVDDGFKVIPHNGRKDFDGKYPEKKLEWFKQLSKDVDKDETRWLYKKIKLSDEWCPEAYVKTDYSTLTENTFIDALKKYSLFLYMRNSELEG